VETDLARLLPLQDQSRIRPGSRALTCGCSHRAPIPRFLLPARSFRSLSLDAERRGALTVISTIVPKSQADVVTRVSRARGPEVAAGRCEQAGSDTGVDVVQHGAGSSAHTQAGAPARPRRGPGSLIARAHRSGAPPGEAPPARPSQTLMDQGVEPSVAETALKAIKEQVFHL